MTATVRRGSPQAAGADAWALFLCVVVPVIAALCLGRPVTAKRCIDNPRQCEKPLPRAAGLNDPALTLGLCF